MHRVWKGFVLRVRKRAGCNGNGAASDEHIGDVFPEHGCADVEAAGSQDLAALQDRRWLTNAFCTVPYQVADGASCG